MLSEMLKRNIHRANYNSGNPPELSRDVDLFYAFVALMMQP
jgi:hypothetical protein